MTCPPLGRASKHFFNRCLSFSWDHIVKKWEKRKQSATTEGLRREHLAHHSYLATEQDAELIRKKGRSSWTFPTTKTRLFGILIADLLGFRILPFLTFIRAKNLGGENSKLKPFEMKRGVKFERFFYYALLVVVFTLFDLWIPVLLLWALPFVTIHTAIFRIRNIARHSGLPSKHDLNTTRNVIHPYLWERIIIASHCVQYHLDHHLFPSVPFYNLPKLHHILMSVPEYAEHAVQTDTYLGFKGSSVLNAVTKFPNASQQETRKPC